MMKITKFPEYLEHCGKFLKQKFLKVYKNISVEKQFYQLSNAFMYTS